MVRNGSYNNAEVLLKDLISFVLELKTCLQVISGSVDHVQIDQFLLFSLSFINFSGYSKARTPRYNSKEMSTIAWIKY